LRARAPAGRQVRNLDLGSGPAPCSIAAADHFGLSDASIVACDQSRAALESASRLCSTAGYRFDSVSGWDAQRSPVPDGSFDLVVAGHLINELWADEPDRLERRTELLETALSRLDPKGALLFLEPALLSTGREAIALRDRLAASGRGFSPPAFGTVPARLWSPRGRPATAISLGTRLLWSANCPAEPASARIW
jgi:SAM-dependent methyltransferase